MKDICRCRSWRGRPNFHGYAGHRCKVCGYYRKEDMEIEELKKPPTAIEIAELLKFVRSCDGNGKAVGLLRRVLFQLDELKNKLGPR